MLHPANLPDRGSRRPHKRRGVHAVAVRQPSIHGKKVLHDIITGIDIHVRAPVRLGSEGGRQALLLLLLASHNVISASTLAQCPPPTNHQSLTGHARTEHSAPTRSIHISGRAHVCGGFHRRALLPPEQPCHQYPRIGGARCFIGCRPTKP